MGVFCAKNMAKESHQKPTMELARDMGLMHVTMIGVGAMIGAGIFVLTGLAAGVAGPALLLVFAFNGLVTGLTAMSTNIPAPIMAPTPIMVTCISPISRASSMVGFWGDSLAMFFAQNTPTPKKCQYQKKDLTYSVSYSIFVLHSINMLHSTYRKSKK